MDTLAARSRRARHFVRRLIVGFGLGVAVCAVAQAPQDVRVALVIGNAGYASPATLTNPLNDAAAVAGRLKGLGFEVIEVRDATRAQITEAVALLGRRLQGVRGIGMFYFAGHGMQVNFRNYLVPVDARLASRDDVDKAAVDVGDVLATLARAGTRMNILVLDACRDHPFGPATTKGLAPVDAPSGTFIAYSTAPGNVAEDSGPRAGNSVYTGYLVEELRRPGARIEDVFKRVRLQVRESTRGKQIPWESTSLEEDFYFDTSAPLRRDAEFAAQRAEWEKIKESHDLAVLYAFARKYPAGNMTEFVEARIQLIEKAALQAQAPAGSKPQVPFYDRFREGDRYEFVVRDGRTGTVVERGLIETRIHGEAADDVAISGNLRGATVTLGGFVIKDADAMLDPPLALLPNGDYQVGKSVRSRSYRTPWTGQPSWIDAESRVVARERLQTAIGLLDTYRVEVVRRGEDGHVLKITLWFDPDWGASMKRVTEFTPRPGATTSVRVREIVSRSRRS